MADSAEPDSAEPRVHLMYPLTRRRGRKFVPRACRAPEPDTYNSSFANNGIPIVIIRPAAYRVPDTSLSRMERTSHAQQEDDDKLLARLAESRKKQEREELARKRAATSQDGSAIKR